MPITRRNALKLAIASMGVSTLSATFLRHALSAPQPDQFTNSLRLPLVLTGRLESGKRIFDLQLQQGHTQFFSDLQTPTAGINGSFLGPTIRANRGENIRINVRNNLAEPSTIHWHGCHLPAAMDGGPHQAIQPGATW